MDYTVDQVTSRVYTKMGGLGKVMGLRKNIDMVLEMYKQFLDLLKVRTMVARKAEKEKRAKKVDIEKQDNKDVRKKEVETDRIMREHGIHRLQEMPPKPKSREELEKYKNNDRKYIDKRLPAYDTSSPVYQASLAKWEKDKKEWDKQNAEYQKQKAFYSQFIGKTPEEITAVVVDAIQKDKISKININVMEAMDSMAKHYTAGKLESNNAGSMQIENGNMIINNLVNAMVDPNSSLPYECVPTSHVKLILDAMPREKNGKTMLGDAKVPPKQDLSQCGLDGLIMFAIDQIYSQMPAQDLVKDGAQPKQYDMVKQMFEAYKTKEVSMDAVASSKDVYSIAEDVITNARKEQEKAQKEKEEAEMIASKEEAESMVRSDEENAQIETDRRHAKQANLKEELSQKFNKDSLEAYRAKKAKAEEVKMQDALAKAERENLGLDVKGGASQPTAPTTPTAPTNRNAPNAPEREDESEMGQE